MTLKRTILGHYIFLRKNPYINLNDTSFGKNDALLVNLYVWIFSVYRGKFTAGFTATFAIKKWRLKSRDYRGKR